MVAELDEKIKKNVEYLKTKDLEKSLELGNNVLPKRTRYELENVLFMRFDIHKKHYRRLPSLSNDSSWEHRLDKFMEMENFRRGMHGKTNRTNCSYRSGLNSEDVYISPKKPLTPD